MSLNISICIKYFVSGIMTSIFFFSYFFLSIKFLYLSNLNLPSAFKHPYHKPKLKFFSSALL